LESSSFKTSPFGIASEDIKVKTPTSSRRRKAAVQQEKTQKNQRIVSQIGKGLIAIVVVAVILANVFTLVLQIVNYNGTGMEPGLHGGQTLVILKGQNVAEGDVIAFYYNNQVLVRRVICDGGKQLEMDANGTVTINGQPLEEPYVETPVVGQCNITFPYHVRTGTVFVMGDNRAQAMDSRLKEIGPVPLDRIIGKVIFTF